jgi:hypothetical protein
MKINEFVSLLFEIEINAHIAHWQTRRPWDHLALGELYEGIVELRDRFVETFQGKNEIVTGYKVQINETIEIKSYIKDCAESVESFKTELSMGSLQQICDDITELLYTTLYKLEKLSE